MPYVNRFRVANVQYNEGRQQYDDFMLTLLGKSTAFEMENGGGKSVLLTMLIQAVLPKTDLSTLSKNRYENLFLSTSNDKPHHSVIEWELDAGSQYRYMVTGFCARKTKTNVNDQEQDDSLDKKSVEHFSYVLYYNKACKYDIESLPLCERSENKIRYIAYDQLREHLNKLKAEKQPVFIFDNNKINYWRHIRNHGILDPEWELIRGVNSGENSVIAYFLQYKKSRSLIENFLLKMIEKIDHMELDYADKGTATEEQLAKTLLDIKDQLKRLIKEKECKQEYLKVIEFYNMLRAIEERLEKKYLELAEINDECAEVYSNLLLIMKELEEQKTGLDREMKEALSQLDDYQFWNKCLEIRNSEIDLVSLTAETELQQSDAEELEKRRDETTAEYNLSRSQNKYLQYLENQEEMVRIQLVIGQGEKEHEQLKEERDLYGYNLVKEIEKEISVFTGLRSESESKLAEVEKKREDLAAQTGKLNTAIGGRNEKKAELERQLTSIEQKIKKLYQEIKPAGSSSLLFLPEEEKSQVSASLIKMRTELSLSQEQKKALENEAHNKKVEEAEKRGSLKSAEKELNTISGYLSEFMTIKRTVDSLLLKYAKNETYEALIARIEEEVRREYGAIAQCDIKEKILQQKIRLLEEKGYYLPNQDIVAYADFLGKKGFATIFFGADYLINDVSDEERMRLLENNPLLPYSLMLSGESYKKLQNNEQLLNTKIGDHPIPVFNYDRIRQNAVPGITDIIFACGDKDQFYNLSNKEDFYKNLLKEQAELVQTKEKAETQLKIKREDKEAVGKFLDMRAEAENKKAEETYLLEQVSDLKQVLQSLTARIKECDKESRELGDKIIQTTSAIKQAEQIEEALRVYIDLERQVHPLKKAIEETDSDLKEYAKLLEISQHEAEINNGVIKEYEEKARQIKAQLAQLEDELKKIEYGNKAGEYLGLKLEEARNQYYSRHESLQNKTNDLLPYRRQRIGLEKSSKQFLDDMKDIGYFPDYFVEKAKSEILLTVSDERIGELKNAQKRLDKEAKSIRQAYATLSGKCNTLRGSINGRKEALAPKAYVLFSELNTCELVKERTEVHNERIQALNASLRKIKEDLDSLEKRKSGYDLERNKFIAFIGLYKIEKRSDVRTERMTSYDELSKNHTRATQQLDVLSEKLKKEIDKIEKEAKTLSLNSDYLATMSEWGNQNCLYDVQRQLSAIDEIVTLIAEKISELDKEIESLEKYQDTFVQQCLQIAESILTKLKKLNSLPKVDVFGQKLRMVKFNNMETEYSADLKIENIREYIFSLVNKVEAEEMKQDKLSLALAPKILLSKIIDLNKIRVMIYKVEPKPEDCRYINWDELEGSEGQANAMTITLLISMLSYIRSLRIGENALKSSKVLIVDNPFGSTGANYLWDPMFDILKKNNFQLITPGWKIEESIVSKFEIYYKFAKQDYANDKTGVVIKEVRTELDLKKVHYEEIKEPTLF